LQSKSLQVVAELGFAIFMHKEREEMVTMLEKEEKSEAT
jgi:hypothetical protein